MQNLRLLAGQQMHHAGVVDLVTRAPAQEHDVGHREQRRMHDHVARRRRAHEEIVETLRLAAEKPGAAEPRHFEMRRELAAQRRNLSRIDHAGHDGVTVLVDGTGDGARAVVPGVEDRK